MGLPNSAYPSERPSLSLIHFSELSTEMFIISPLLALWPISSGKRPNKLGAAAASHPGAKRNPLIQPSAATVCWAAPLGLSPPVLSLS